MFGAPAHADALRIGFVSAEFQQGCFAPGDIEPELARQYASHLDKRFSAEVQLCFAPDAQGLAKGSVDLAWGQRSDLEVFGSAYRPFLTSRLKGGSSRVPIVVFQSDTSEPLQMDELEGRALAYNGQEPTELNRDAARKLLGNFGHDEKDLSWQPFQGAEATVEAVRTKKAEVGALEVTAWGRNCNVYRPDQKGCGDMRVIAMLRPRAESGMIIRNDLSKEIRYRMVGVHAHLHLEEPGAAAWVLGRADAEFEPLEADAFNIGSTGGI